MIDGDGRWWWEFGQACVLALGVLAAGAEWPRYQALFRRVSVAATVAADARDLVERHEDRLLELEAWREEFAVVGALVRQGGSLARGGSPAPRWVVREGEDPCSS